MKMIISLIASLLNLAVPHLSSAEDLRDIKQPVEWPTNYVLIFSFLFLIIIIIVILIVLYVRRRILRKINSVIVVRNPPWVLALDELDALKRKNLPSLGKIKEFYSFLSDIVRHYIEERFSIRAPEMTTPEFLRHLKNSQVLDDKQREALEIFLYSCDMVKFAKYGPTLNEADYSYELARKFIEETRQEPPGDKTAL